MDGWVLGRGVGMEKMENKSRQIKLNNNSQGSVGNTDYDGTQTGSDRAEHLI